MPNIIYEDNQVIVAVKPPNMLSQADKTGDTDILSQLKEYIRIKCIRSPGGCTWAWCTGWTGPWAG